MHTKLFTMTLAIGFAAGIGCATAATQPVNLRQQQKQSIQQQLSSKSAQAVPAGFTAQVGAKVPQSVILHPLPTKSASNINSVKSDDYAKLKNNKILIVNPTNRKVVAIIQTSGSTTGSSMKSGGSMNLNVPNSPK
jgi:hypothetical protein